MALIDTEHGSSGKYANVFDFDNEVMEGPYDPRNLITKIMECEAAGEYGVLIIDSLSHFWEGSGGLLEMVDKFGNKAKGNKFAGWKKEGTPNPRPNDRSDVGPAYAHHCDNASQAGTRPR